MTKVYDHAVIYNGTFYPAGSLIEEKVESAVKSSEGGSDKKPSKRVGGKNESRAD